MSMMYEPESWIGLRSERSVAGDFTARSPEARRARRGPAAAAQITWPSIRSVLHRTIGLMLGR